ncbi:MAG: NADH-quinone oxidoreductase subunit G [Candidatus Krumholzibacteriia bacterium]
MARLTIDEQVIEVPDGTRLFDACTQARGEALPHFCYHPDLSIAGVCRLCQVEIEGAPKLTIACNTTVKDGMVVRTRSPRVQEAATRILEMHLINHPVDCPICDQAGECGLQDQYMQYGLYASDVAKTDKVHKRKAEPIGPYVILDKERCVLCSRCVRFCAEITRTGELGILQRGDRAEIAVAPGRELTNAYSLNTVDICPVGALTSRDFRFQKRVWLLRSTASVCPGCATGCNVRVDHEGGRVWRLRPRRNDAVNGPWLCDPGRMEYKRLHAADRLTQPLVRRDGVLQPAEWRVAWSELERRVRAGGVALALANPHQTVEELFLFRRLAELLGGAEAVYGGLAGADRGEGDALLIDADRAPNRAALGWLGLREAAADELAARLGPGRTAVVYGGDPAAASPRLASALAAGEVIYLGTRRGATAEAAALVLPLAMWAEKDGLLANRQGRLQALRAAIARPGTAREDWRVLAEWLARLGAPALPATLAALRREVAAALELPPGTDLNALPATGFVARPGADAPAAGGR